ncbi:anti-sigma28 factor FlgM [Desulfosporosinus acididurans]|uniref:Negative regulator of flagellin synthesis n=2 Tax=Desulfosporosinus acididurans TaxID=476652 RepID=A0A0J1FRE6_9FIRM|nr:anti-sigma28 factor FlgM [Desulfosporosinus acididurans]
MEKVFLKFCLVFFDKQSKTMYLGVNEMKVDPTFMSLVSCTQAANRLKPAAKNRSTSETDNVAVSDKVQTFQTLLQKAKEVSDVREDRVQTLSKQIERGEFKVDAQKIAAKLLPPNF